MGAGPSAGGCGKSPASVDADGLLTPLLEGSSWRVAAAHACSRRSCRQTGSYASPDASSIRSPPAGNPCPRVVGKSRSRVARSTLVPCTHNRPTTNPLLPRFPRRSRRLDRIGKLPGNPTAPAAIATRYIGSKGRAHSAEVLSRRANPRKFRRFRTKRNTRRRGAPGVRKRSFPRRTRSRRAYASTKSSVRSRGIW